MNIAEAVNILGRFCGPRDIPALQREALRERWGVDRADVYALFGGSILAGGDLLAEAMERGLARHYVIVGGEGHTTQTLRRKMRAAFPEVETEGQPEAAIFDAYLRTRYGRRADLLECASTNCGNNITNLLALLDREGIRCARVILTQDATMQRRMAAGLEKYRPDIQIVNYAAYQATVAEVDGALAFEEDIRGMWDMERYISLLLGEIVRLTDDARGYGPRGADYIAHVDIPEDVARAFALVRERFPRLVRGQA